MRKPAPCSPNSQSPPPLIRGQGLREFARCDAFNCSPPDDLTYPNPQELHRTLSCLMTAWVWLTPGNRIPGRVHCGDSTPDRDKTSTATSPWARNCHWSDSEVILGPVSWACLGRKELSLVRFRGDSGSCESSMPRKTFKSPSFHDFWDVSVWSRWAHSQDLISYAFFIEH